MKHMSYSFVPISSLESVAKDGIVDVIGIVKEVGTANNFTSKAGKELTKRDVVLVDKSSTSINFTLWGEKTALVDESSLGAVLAVKGARVGDYGGRTLGSSGTTDIAVNPSIPEAVDMRSWWDVDGSTKQIASLSGSGGGGMTNGPTNNAAARKALGAIKIENLGSSDAGDVFTAKATVSFIKADTDKAPWYPACAKPDCSKKAVQDMAGTSWHCEKVGWRGLLLPDRCVRAWA